MSLNCFLTIWFMAYSTFRDFMRFLWGEPEDTESYQEKYQANDSGSLHAICGEMGMTEMYEGLRELILLNPKMYLKAVQSHSVNDRLAHSRLALTKSYPALLSRCLSIYRESTGDERYITIEEHPTEAIGIENILFQRNPNLIEKDYQPKREQLDSASQ